MTVPNKTPSVQMFRLSLHQRALHPELFGIQDRLTITQADQYDFEAWIVPGGHVLRFQNADNLCLTETVTDQDAALPERGLLHALPCIGEKEHDETIEDVIRYVTTVQTESLSENLYSATLNEMRDFAAEADALSYEWAEADGQANLSLVDIQRYRGEIHAQSYHLLENGGFVLRTQTIFELV